MAKLCLERFMWAVGNCADRDSANGIRIRVYASGSNTEEPSDLYMQVSHRTVAKNDRYVAGQLHRPDEGKHDSIDLVWRGVCMRPLGAMTEFLANSLLAITLMKIGLSPGLCLIEASANMKV
jgi:hypothetical protein